MDYIEIKDLVNDILLSIGEDNYDKDNKYHQLELYALQGLKELNLDVNRQVKTKSIVVDQNTYTAAFPSDCIKVLKVGVMDSQGRLQPLGRDKDLSLDQGLSSQVDAPNDYIPSSRYYSPTYGRGGGQNSHGLYRIDRDSQTIQFGSEMTYTDVVIEYVSNGFSDGIVPGTKRIVDITVPAASEIEDGDSISLRYIDAAGVEGIMNLIFNEDSDTSTPEGSVFDGQNFKIYIGISPTGDSGHVATRVADAISLASPYHSATASGSVAKVTYDKTADWTGSESSIGVDLAAMEGVSFNVVQAGSAESGTLKITCPQFAEEALRSYVYWKAIQRKRGVPMGEKQIARKEYYNQKRLAKARSQSFSKEEALQQSRKNFKQSPKL